MHTRNPGHYLDRLESSSEFPRIYEEYLDEGSGLHHGILNDLSFGQSIVSGEEGDGFEKSLLGLRGQRWKNVRSTLTPSFTSKKLKQVSTQKWDEMRFAGRISPGRSGE